VYYEVTVSDSHHNPSPGYGLVIRMIVLGFTLPFAEVCVLLHVILVYIFYLHSIIYRLITVSAGGD